MLVRCAILFLILGAGSAAAGEFDGCLGPEQRRAAIHLEVPVDGLHIGVDGVAAEAH